MIMSAAIQAVRTTDGLLLIRRGPTLLLDFLRCYRQSLKLCLCRWYCVEATEGHLTDL